MKKYIICNSTDASSTNIDPETIAEQIEALFKAEEIPYIYVECVDDNPIVVVAITYGDWKNDNDRADYLVEQNFKPKDSYYEDKDPYAYLDEDIAERYEGSDMCVTKHEWTW